MSEKQLKQEQIDVPEVLKKIDHELHKANITDGFKRLEINIDVEAIRLGEIPSKKVGICSQTVTDD